MAAPRSNRVGNRTGSPVVTKARTSAPKSTSPAARTATQRRGQERVGEKDRATSDIFCCLSWLVGSGHAARLGADDVVDHAAVERLLCEEPLGELIKSL